MTVLSTEAIEEPLVNAEAMRGRRHYQPEVLVALLGFALFSAIVLLKATAMLEPDDLAYRASIVALGHGEILLSNAQYLSLQHELAATGSSGVAQWHHMASGAWISEKNPGYPFFAVLFSMLGLLRVGPLFFGALACVGLYAGARAWLGKWAGTYAVSLYCFSGAALVFAWRATMPSFTDASLIAAAFGALVYVGCSPHLRSGIKSLIGLLAFLALEGAVFIRYTNLTELVVVAVAVLTLRKAMTISWRNVAIWLGSIVVFGLGVLAFNDWAYGKPTSTGYSSGEISFSLSSLWANLKGMPKQLSSAMPLWVLAAIALACIIVRLGLLARERDATIVAERSRDAAIATVLGIGWLALWVLYLTYTWTAGQLGGSGPRGGTITVHVIRFYLPALGCVTLLATWTLSKLQAWLSWPILGALVIAGVLSFNSMAGSGTTGGPGNAGPGGGSGQFQPPGPSGSGLFGPGQ